MKKSMILALAALAVSSLSGVASAGCGGCGGDEGHTHAKPAMKQAEVKTASILATAKASGFETLAAAVQAAGLTETLESEGPFTVFAPTDEAFAKLPAGALESLLDDPDALRDVLLYHVVAGKVSAADVVKLDSAKSASGKTIAIDTEDGVSVAGAKVVMTDVAASNGLIHVIDSVMLP